jgi:hypothetical protein
LLDAVKERARYLYLSLRAEEACAYWVKHFVAWHGRRHPRETGGAEVEAFPTMPATGARCRCPMSTHRAG